MLYWKSVLKVFFPNEGNIKSVNTETWNCLSVIRFRVWQKLGEAWYCIMWWHWCRSYRPTDKHISYYFRTNNIQNVARIYCTYPSLQSYYPIFTEFMQLDLTDLNIEWQRNTNEFRKRAIFSTSAHLDHINIILCRRQTKLPHPRHLICQIVILDREAAVFLRRVTAPWFDVISFCL